MSILEKRSRLKAAYPNKTWSTRVDLMEDRQVSVIYTRLQQQGKI